MPRPHAADLSAGSLDAEALPPEDPGASSSQPFNRLGSARYVRAGIALFLAGFATFSLLYCPQPLLPALTRAFGVGAAAASLAISLATGALALSIAAAAAVSDRWGRRGVMFVSLMVAAGFNALAALAPSWSTFLGARTLEGLALGGVPAVAMTYLAEETEPAGLGLAMGIYVGATAVGGMSGRVLTGIAAAETSWRGALGVIAGLGILAALGFAALLPASRHFRPRTLDLVDQGRAYAAAARKPGLLPVYGFAFLVMGGFVAVYNYAGFRLEAPPFDLTPAQEGLIFTLYLLGTASSAAAGALADRFGRAPVLLVATLLAICGVLATCLAALTAIVLGIALLTLGFFAGHAVASGSVGPMAGAGKAQAASFYLLAYYAGSSLLGTAGGLFWDAGGWPAVAAFVTSLYAGALLLGVGLVRRLPASVGR